MSEANRAQRQILLGAAVSALGLLLAGTVAPGLGIVALAGWGLLAVGLHRLGRAAD
jgi:hypothetical protein